MSRRDRVQLQQTQEEQSQKLSQETQENTPEQAAPQQNNGQNNILNLQRTHGNQAVQRMLGRRIQRSTYMNGGPLNEEISNEINSKRGSGHNLDSGVQREMGAAMGHDFSGVNVHTDSQSDQLNKDLGAKAFTTGNDIFFSSGSYDPGSSSGKELLAHELTHVVQQSGSAPASSNLTLGPAEDSYESEADSIAKSVTSGASGAQAMRDPDVQRQDAPEEEEEMMMKRDPDIQRQDVPEEEEMMMKRDPDVQRQDVPEEEEMMMKRDPDVQRETAPEEEEMMMKRDPSVQRETAPEEEEMMMKRDPSVQREVEKDL